MSFFTSFLRVITFGLYKEPKKKDEREDYYEDQKDACYWWDQSIINVYSRYECDRACITPYIPTMSKVGIDFKFVSSPEVANIIIVREGSIEKGGVTHRTTKGRVIQWVKLVIASREPEIGKRHASVCIHEGGHALGLTHDGAKDVNVMHPTAQVPTLDPQTERTLERIYEGMGNEKEP
jgi:hypothetical protein